MLQRVYVDPADAEAVKAIPLGYAQETTLDRSRATSIIGKLERMGAIPKGAFRARIFRDGETKKVAIVHESNGEQTSGTITLSSKLPTPEAMAAFIETLEAYRHDLSSIAQHFLGRDVDSHSNSTEYFNLRSAAIEARELIEKKHGGKFTEEKAGHHKVYSWAKE
jgi:hypothetical protein